MITLEKVKQEIRELQENGCMTTACIQDLTMLYWLKEQMGRDTHGTVEKLDRDTAEKWVKSMKHADGTEGEHWSYDATYQAMKQRNIDCDPVSFYAAMNMLWSDYGVAASRHNAYSLDFWSEMAKAFLRDPDAVENKLGAYYHYIVKK